MKKILPVLAGAVILLGIGLRFYRITEPDFVFYDEGYYLNWSRPLGELMATHHLKGEDVARAVQALIK